MNFKSKKKLVSFLRMIICLLRIAQQNLGAVYLFVINTKDFLSAWPRAGIRESIFSTLRKVQEQMIDECASLKKS